MGIELLIYLLLVQKLFITSYLTTLAAGDMLEDYVPADSEVEELIDEVRCFTMASHLFWTLWGIVNVHQEIEFGYWVSSSLVKLMIFVRQISIKLSTELRIGTCQGILCR